MSIFVLLIILTRATAFHGAGSVVGIDIPKRPKEIDSESVFENILDAFEFKTHPSTYWLLLWNVKGMLFGLTDALFPSRKLIVFACSSSLSSRSNILVEQRVPI